MGTTARVHRIPKCDFCKMKPEDPDARDAVYDGKTRGGPWAFMCEEHWQTFGCGILGTGYGQKLVLDEAGE